MMLITLAQHPDKFDVIIIDDHSERINIEAKAAELGVKVLRQMPLRQKEIRIRGIWRGPTSCSTQSTRT